MNTPGSPAASPQPDLEILILKIKDDLANRLAIPAEAIDLLEVTEVEWSDSSLDCPQPEMSYLPVITPGYRIILQANEQLYEYHATKTASFIYCENQGPPAVPQ